jgi:hypothetical protein
MGYRLHISLEPGRSREINRNGETLICTQILPVKLCGKKSLGGETGKLGGNIIATGTVGTHVSHNYISCILRDLCIPGEHAPLQF